MNTILETERLLLREFNPDDTEFILQLLNSPGWLEFIGDRNVKTKEDAANYLLNGPIKSYTVNGFGLSMVALKDSGIPIGMCGLIRRATLEHVDIGFAFLPEFSGNGYAFEIASAVITHAKTELKLKQIVAITIPTNVRSIKLLNKIGLHFEKYIKMPGDEEQLMLFSLNHDEDI